MKKKKKKVYVVFTVFLLDAQARYAFVSHSSFNTIYGCTLCLQEGETIKSKKGHSHIYPPEEIDLRTQSYHNDLLDLIENGQAIPIMGVKGRAAVLDVRYFNHLDSTIPEAMHLFSGIIKRIFSSFTSAKKSKCFIKKKCLIIIEDRIKKFTKITFTNSIFKRRIQAFSNFNQFKANQHFQFFFYVFPVVFKGILEENTYKLNFLLIYIFSSLWDKELNESDLDYLDELIFIYHTLISQCYPMCDYTFNNHQLLHLVKAYKDHGPLNRKNAFVFEHLNGVIQNHIEASFGVLEQICEKSALMFVKNSKCASSVLKSGHFRTTCSSDKIEKISNDFLFVTSSNKKGLSKDHFIMSNENKFYEILKFYYVNSSLFFKAKEFKIIDNLSINLDFDEIHLEQFQFDKIDLHFIYKVEQRENVIDLPTNLIKEKVLYCPTFESKKSNFVNLKSGLIIRCIYGTNN